MAMKVEIPENFKPKELEPLKKKEGRDIRFWVYSENGEGKTYDSATAKEVSEFAKALDKDHLLAEENHMGLLPAKALALDLGLKVAIIRTRNLFGGPEVWENMPEWQRASRIFKKKDKNDK